MMLVLLRHAQVDAGGRYYGALEYPITSQGQAHARSLAPVFAQGWDAVLASPRVRVLQTLEAMQLTPTHIDDRWAELCFGRWEGLTYDQIRQQWPQECGAWEKDWLHVAPPGGESARQVYDRQAQAIDELLDCGYERVLLAAHQGSLRNVLAYLLHGTPEGCWRYRFEYCGSATLQIVDRYAYLTVK